MDPSPTLDEWKGLWRVFPSPGHTESPVDTSPWTPSPEVPPAVVSGEMLHPGWACRISKDLFRNEWAVGPCLLPGDKQKTAPKWTGLDRASHVKHSIWVSPAYMPLQQRHQCSLASQNLDAPQLDILMFRTQSPTTQKTEDRDISPILESTDSRQRSTPRWLDPGVFRQGLSSCQYCEPRWEIRLLKKKKKCLQQKI